MPIHDSADLNPGTEFFWPDWEHYPRNQYGFLDRPPLNPRPAHVFRVLIVGDSYVEGAGLSREEMFGRVLEREANRVLAESGQGIRLEVLSWGQSGNNAEENVSVIRNLPPRIDPDLVILEYTLLNDSETHPITLKHHDPPGWAKKVQAFFLLEVKSYACYWFYKRFTFFRVRREPGFNLIRARHREGFCGWEKTKEAFGNLARWLDKAGTDGMVLIFPILTGLPGYPQDFREAHRKLGLALERNRLPYLDLLDFFSNTGAARSDLVFSPDDSHPSALANRLLGLYLAERIPAGPGFRKRRKEIEAQRVM